MIYKVTGYYETGFNSSNIPYSPAVLDANMVRRKEFDSIYHWQDSYLSSIDINASFQEVENIDYVKVGDSFYFVDSIEMKNETKCATLHLTQDALSSMGGVPGITSVSGWAKRAHTSNDELFSNTIEEPFTPQSELQLEYGGDIGGTSEQNVRIICSSVNLDDIGDEAIRFVLPGTDNPKEDSILIPVPKQVSYETKFYFPISSVARQEAVLPRFSAFIVTSSNEAEIEDSLKKLQGIGALSEAISYFYCIPVGLVKYSFFESSGLATQIKGISKTEQISLPFKYSNVKNNKVFAQFNKYRVLSLASGDYKDFEAHDIISGSETSPNFTFFVDPAPEGRPYCRPTTYKKNNTDMLLNAVQGSPWLNNPIAASGRSGRKIDEYEFMTGTTQRIFESSAQAITGLANVKNYAKPLDYASREGIGLISTLYDETLKKNLLLAKNYAVAPEINFPRGNSIQNYTGNAFYIYRVRLSENDVQRFDKFLTMYGYACDKPLEMSDFNNRTYFNYIQADDVHIQANAGMRIREKAESQLMNGVRIWHTIPNPIYYNTNPIRS